ncbi:hypothetical protein ZOSMA_101G00010 [Zostera marina]|uniref:SAGA-associated factor 11 n=1 Tax=Zostera marina TaxID=29655 RepID=A0A0K9Q558_ZOSMR|nr:hypothetical protein ZOSMA_101G00010 [Zostera marina]
MVSKLDHVRMASMARLLSYGNHMEITSETTFDTLVVQTVHREFHEADEANLLEEKDMHIYDSRPLSDPLHLVLCNACQKPIKASQYSIHAELCRSFKSSEDIVVELNGGLGNKKPPKKGKKKFQSPCTNQGTTGEKDKSESVDADSVFYSELNIDGNSGMHNSYISRAPALADNIVTREFSEASNISRKQTTDISAPLATKMYYTNGRCHLRAAISHLYRQTITEDISSILPTSKLVQENVMPQTQVINHIKQLNGSQNENIAHQFC